MAAVVPPAEKATDLLQKLSLDSQTKVHDAPDDTNKPVGPVDGGNIASVPVPSNERSMTPFLQDFMDPGMCYLPSGYASPTYYYGAYDSSVNPWENYPRYINPEEMSSTGAYGDIYHHGYGYAPYGAYTPPGSPVPTLGHDGQLYGPQHYQYPGPYYPLATSTCSTFRPTPVNQQLMSQAEISKSLSVDQPFVSMGATKANTNAISNGNSNNKNMTVPLNSKPQNPLVKSNGLYGRGTLPSIPTGYPGPRYSYDAVQSPIPWLDSSVLTDVQQRLGTANPVSSMISHIGHNISSRVQNLHPVPHPTVLHTCRPASAMEYAAPRFVNSSYPSSKSYGQCGNAYSTGLGFTSNGYDLRKNGCGWLPTSNGNRSFCHGNESTDSLCELKKGPRSGCFKSQNMLGPNVKIAVRGQNLQFSGSKEDTSSVPDRNLFNKADFPEKYSDAKFFVIKSFSEDDVHKSIKYNVWASTQTGNKKLDAAYQEMKEKHGGCPVFLFFSVNTSGQFVGVAEMVGRVDFDKTVDYWLQDRWNGCFPVKWHVIKDVPNSILKHIILQNNDNKPVTNSRDTQEVKMEQGLQMLKLFKEHVSETSLLDDFLFYEFRQRTMREKRAKEQQFHKVASFKVWSGNSTDVLAIEAKERDAVEGKPKLEKPLEIASVSNKEAGQGTLGEGKPSGNGMTTVVGETPNIVTLASEKRVVANGVSKGC